MSSPRDPFEPAHRDIATEDKAEGWLRAVPGYTAPDFARLVDLASRDVQVLQIAAEVVDSVMNEPKSTDRVTFTGIGRQMPARRHQAIPNGVPKAAAWFLTHARCDIEGRFIAIGPIERGIVFVDQARRGDTSHHQRPVGQGRADSIPTYLRDDQ